MTALRPPAALLGLLLIAAPAATFAGVTAVERPDPKASNRHYPGNRPPLLSSPFVKLPVGAVRPGGWLRKQLELQADGFHGHLGSISEFLRKPDNSWLSPNGQGKHGWEEVPYWLKGFGDCAYLLGRDDQVKEARLWVEAVLRSQRDDGYFGPRGNGAAATVASTQGKYDLWPNMVVLDCLRSYHEFTRDERVPKFMERYFRWELAVPDADFLPPYWQQQRAADNLASVYWLYNRTGDAWLLELAEKIHRHTADWTSGVPNWHNVNMTQAFGGPSTFWPQSKDPRHLAASERNFQTIRSLYGQVPGGLFGGDENCRPGYSDPRQAVETCGMVEFMHSAERLVTITGETVWADRCEDVAFNSLPAAQTADLKALRYLTSPNMAVSDRRSHAPGIENGGPMFHMNPFEHRCCQHNVGQGWPYLAEHLWLATADDGLAAAFPLESAVTAKVGDGTVVTVSATTHYPFSDRVEFAVKAPKPVAFPLYLRVPGWCDGPELAVNGTKAMVPTPSRGYLRVDRTWADGDRVSLRVPMNVRLRTWEKNHGSVSVDRGPLTYSLAIGERHVRNGGTDEWPAWEIRPTTPWNYGLVLDGQDPARSFKIEERDWPGSNVPFTPEAVPVRLAARGKRIPEWTLDRYGLVAPLQDSPVRSDEPAEPVTLIPMGAARLRISAFPVIGTGPDAHRWAEAPRPKYEVTASHCFESDDPNAVADGLLPKNSDDHAVPRLTWWPHKGTAEWVEAAFSKPRPVSRVAVYWFDDTGHGGCGVPASWRLLYRDGGDWKHVPNPQADPVSKDRWNHLRFNAVTTSALRLEVRLRPELSGGVLEWIVE